MATLCQRQSPKQAKQICWNNLSPGQKCCTQTKTTHQHECILIKMICAGTSDHLFPSSRKKILWAHAIIHVQLFVKQHLLSRRPPDDWLISPHEPSKEGRPVLLEWSAADVAGFMLPVCTALRPASTQYTTPAPPRRLQAAQLLFMNNDSSTTHRSPPLICLSCLSVSAFSRLLHPLISCQHDADSLTSDFNVEELSSLNAVNSQPTSPHARTHTHRAEQKDAVNSHCSAGISLQKQQRDTYSAQELDFILAFSSFSHG